MTPEDEIAEIVKGTIATKLSNFETTYQIPSFPELYVSRISTMYCVRLEDEFCNDENIIRKFEKLKETFKPKQIEIRNLILDRPQSIVFSGTGKVVTNSLCYYDCVFTSEELIGDLFCHDCVYCNEENE